jgi:hypothetical protein
MYIYVYIYIYEIYIYIYIYIHTYIYIYIYITYVVRYSFFVPMDCRFLVCSQDNSFESSLNRRSGISKVGL